MEEYVLKYWMQIIFKIFIFFVDLPLCYWYVFAIISSTVKGRSVFYTDLKLALSRLFPTAETCFINNWINFIDTKSVKKHF